MMLILFQMMRGYPHPVRYIVLAMHDCRIKGLNPLSLPPHGIRAAILSPLAVAWLEKRKIKAQVETLSSGLASFPTKRYTSRL